MCEHLDGDAVDEVDDGDDNPNSDDNGICIIVIIQTNIYAHKRNWFCSVARCINDIMSFNIIAIFP